MRRRSFLTAAGAAAAAGLGLKAARDHDEAALRADVFIARAGSYTEDLEQILRDGLRELGLGPAACQGQNRSCSSRTSSSRSATEPQINTHPAVVRAAAEVFRRWQAREVLVAEGQGHCRDSQYVLDESGLAPVLAESRLEFMDLNHDDVVRVPNALGCTRLRELMLPLTLRRADLIVSMPKMKTHHWAGVTLVTQEPLRRDARRLLRLAQERAPPRGNSRVHPRHRRRRPPPPGHRRRHHRHGRRRPDHGYAESFRRPGHGHQPARRRRHLHPPDGHRPLARSPTSPALRAGSVPSPRPISLSGARPSRPSSSAISF